MPLNLSYGTLKFTIYLYTEAYICNPMFVQGSHNCSVAMCGACCIVELQVIVL